MEKFTNLSPLYSKHTELQAVRRPFLEKELQKIGKFHQSPLYANFSVQQNPTIIKFYAFTPKPTLFFFFAKYGFSLLEY